MHLDVIHHVLPLSQRRARDRDRERERGPRRGCSWLLAHPAIAWSRPTASPRAGAACSMHSFTTLERVRTCVRRTPKNTVSGERPLGWRGERRDLDAGALPPSRDAANSRPGHTTTTATIITSAAPAAWRARRVQVWGRGRPVHWLSAIAEKPPKLTSSLIQVSIYVGWEAGCWPCSTWTRHPHRV